MIKRMPMEKNHIVARCFQERFLGLMESRSSWKIVKLIYFFEETGRCPEGRNRKLHAEQHIGVVQVVWHLVSSCTWRWKKETEKEKNLQVGEVDGISCQHLQVMVANLLEKHWEWQEERNSVMKRGMVVRPTTKVGARQIPTAYWTGIKPGKSKELGQQSLLSVCGSRTRPICQRWSGCWTTSKKELKKVSFSLHGQEISSRLEIGPTRKPLARAHALFYTGLKEVGGNEFEINVVYGKIQMKLFLKCEMLQLQNTLLKEKVLQEKVGISNSTLFSRSVQNRVW